MNIPAVLYHAACALLLALSRRVERANARDWFVLADNESGDGSRAKPLATPGRHWTSVRPVTGSTSPQGSGAAPDDMARCASGCARAAAGPDLVEQR